MINNRLQQLVHQQLLTNRHQVDGHQYTVPSVQSYPYQWLWDSCFHTILLTHFSIPDAKAELRSLLAKQWSSGMIPHMNYWQEHHEVLLVNWGTTGTSSLTQPPLIAYAAWRIYQKDGDANFLKEIYPALERYHQYLLTRRLPFQKLLGIINPDESGEDNSPRFDRELKLPPDHTMEVNSQTRFALFDRHQECGFEATACTKKHFWSEDVAFNTYMVWNTRMLAMIANSLKLTKEANYWERRAEEIAEAMRKELMRDGVFYSRDSSGSLVAINTWSHFVPLIANLYTKSEAKQLVENHLLNRKEFWTQYPVPTVALNEVTYNPKEPTWGEAWQHPNWRGPVWMSTNWLIFHGLKNYGFDEAAVHIRTQSLALIERSGLREYYHPETGAGMGAKGFTWGGLVIDMN